MKGILIIPPINKSIINNFILSSGAQELNSNRNKQ